MFRWINNFDEGEKITTKILNTQSLIIPWQGRLLFLKIKK